MTDIAAVIRREHARIRRLLGELDDALAEAGLDGPGPAGRLSQSWAVLAALLEAHLDVVEEICFLPLAAVSPAAGQAISQAESDGADLRETLREAELHPPGSREWLLAVRAAAGAARSQLSCVDTALAEYARRAAPRDRDTLHQQWIAYSQVRILGD